MPIALTEDHRALADTVRSLLASRNALGSARERLEGVDDAGSALWKEVAGMGWLGLHVPEGHGGSGFGLAELVVVVEELGRVLTPGPFVPTVIVSSVIAAAADDALCGELLPGLADGTLVGAVALSGEVTVSDGQASGAVAGVLGAGQADVFLVPSGDDVAVVRNEPSVSVELRQTLDPTRPAGDVTFAAAPAVLLPGARQHLTDVARTILAAEAVGVAHACTDRAAAYAKEREQFGRPIGMYQAVKHHCANMFVAAELSTAAVWDAARAASSGGQQFSYAAASAACLAAPAADLCANLGMQVHGGIGFTWEHDAHLYMRRATTLLALLDPDGAAAEVTALARSGAARTASLELPPEAEAFRREARSFAQEAKALDDDARLQRFVETGYGTPHWPKPWGRGAGALEQLVIQEEFAAAGIVRPHYGITGWVILTLIQHATDDQIARWVPSALRREVIWCQLFSEPDAGSDAAGIKTRGTRVEGGWVLNGQKVWTSSAHVAGRGLATIRTNPDAPKHAGITTMVIDLHAPGVEVRPLRTTTGTADFNEVFLDDVFVPDDDVVGKVDDGWTVARATLGNESVSIGGGLGMSIPPAELISRLDANPEGLPGGTALVGRYVARSYAVGMLNLRSAHRAVAGGAPGPEGAVTKLALTELGHDAAAYAVKLAGPEAVYLDGEAAATAELVLMHRALSIAGGTSEIKRNQIGERILGLPRDPLVR